VYPSLYRAKAVSIRSGAVEVFVPQVFGETAITITDALGELPTTSGMGWVFFQAGNPEFPVWASGLVAEAPSPIPPEPPVEGGAGYVHIQGTVSSTWVVVHNLGFQPNVTVEDSSGSTVEGEVVHDTADRLTLTFSAAFSGTAYCS
jgi:hypothetical protein